MLWNMIVEAKNEDELTSSITVEATNWYGALRAGLGQHNIDGSVLTTLSCAIQADKSVVASDVVSKRVFVLRPVITETPAGEGFSVEQNSPSKDDPDNMRETEADDVGLVPHEIFLERDDHPDDGSGIYYRERLIAVEPGISKSAAAHLAHHYFDLLKSEPHGDGKRFISIHLYDHTFDARSERPAVTALTWREWQKEKPKILYPLSGDEGMTFSMLPPPPEPILLIPSVHGKGEATSNNGVPSAASAENETGRYGISERMISAFEAMQDIYGIHQHDEAARFVLSLARDLIRCDAGSCMLISPKQYELYVSAAQGAKAEPHICKIVSSRRGIIGFSLTNSAVITVSDPAGDGRFDDLFDGREGFAPKNVLCAPMQFEGQVIGIIELVDSARTLGFSDEDADVLSYLGTSFAEYAALSLPSRYEDFSDTEFESAIQPLKSPEVNRMPHPEPLREKKDVRAETAPQAAAKSNAKRSGSKKKKNR